VASSDPCAVDITSVHPDNSRFILVPSHSLFFFLPLYDIFSIIKSDVKDFFLE